MLANQYNQNVANQMAAANALYGAGSNTANSNANLAEQQANMQTAGIGTDQAALAAKNYAPNSLLQLQQQQTQLPFTNLGMLASLLYPMAGLGGQSTGQGTSNTQSTGFGLGLSNFMKS